VNHPPEAPRLERLTALHDLERSLGLVFANPGLLDQALRHSSYAHENPQSGPSNEQLEFLGDAVLSLTVSHLLLETFPDSPEGELSRRRAALVNARQLAALARELKLGDYLMLGKGEEHQGGRKKPSLLADALEAVLAAVFLDGGLTAVTPLIRTWFMPLVAAQGEPLFEDAKTALQELAQARGEPPPAYQLLEESGPGHRRFFRMEVRLGGRSLGVGTGPSKKQAAQAAARQALALLRQEAAPP
jgi:ribonuclease-3